MTRLAVIAPKAHQKAVIETLHDIRLTHIEEFTQEEDDRTLDIGEPLPEASRSSELLVRLRSIISVCKLEEETPSRQLTEAEVRDRLQTQLPEIEEEVDAAADRRDEIARDLDTVRDRIQRLKPLTTLPLELEDYRGYESLKTFVGKAPSDLDEDLSTAISRYEVFASEDVQAIFVAEDEAQKAQEILARSGFRELEVPGGEGPPGEELARLQARADQLQGQLEAARADLEQVAQTHGDLLLAAEEILSIETEKAEAPLNFASTERAFVVDAWVPTEHLDTVKDEIRGAVGDSVHFEIIDEGDRDEHHREADPPTKYDHPTGVKPFSFLLDLFSPPQYEEIDPTIILFLVFPLFFGFMIGDLGYGILMVALGLLLYRRLGARSEAARSLGYALLLSGVWAALFGGLIFGDIFGIPYVSHGEEHLFWFDVAGHGHHSLTGISVGEHSFIAENPYGIHKVTDSGVKAMLALSVLAAFVHLFIGFAFGFINHLGHSTKHAVAQIGWMATLGAILLLTLFEGPTNSVSAYLVEAMNLGTAEWTSHGIEALHLAPGAMNWVLYLLVPGLGILLLTEGFMGAMETLGLFSNVISYTRLAGVAVAKGAMAGGFNGMFLYDMAIQGTGAFVIAMGILLFIVAQLLVFVLGLISSGIQGIRLNYVEFFLKFYEGGGEPFRPFGRERKYTIDPSTEST